MNFFEKYARETALVALAFLNIFVWLAVYDKKDPDILSVYFLDVGQGDAILIESPDKNRILIDGGPNNKVLSELGRILPFGDRKIDVVVETHPDKDHIGGLLGVADRFDIGAFVEPGVEAESDVDDALLYKINSKNIPRFTARKGMTIDLGDGVKFYVLFPDRDIAKWETNDASIVGKLVYKDSTFLFTGDSPARVEYILSEEEELLDSDVLKAGHHGSRTSTTDLYLEAVTPEYAVISAGRDNSYGHPHKEVLDNLNKAGSKILSTMEGAVVFKTDGREIFIK